MDRFKGIVCLCVQGRGDCLYKPPGSGGRFFFLEYQAEANCYRGKVEVVRGKETEIQEKYLVRLVKAVRILTLLLLVNWKERNQDLRSQVSISL